MSLVKTGEISMVEKIKQKINNIWLTHREYIIGGVVGFVIGVILF